MSATTTTFASILKEHYTDKQLYNLATQKTPLFTALKKKYYESVGGSKFVQPLAYALPGGGSSTFSTANAATSNESKWGKFEVQHAKHYRVCRVDNELIARTSTGSEDAFMSAVDEFDKGILAEGQYINHRLYRGWGGAIGLSTGISTTTITMSDPSDVMPVRVGDVLKAASTDGTSGAVRTGSVTVASVDRVLGTITCTGNVTAGIAAAVAGDYFFADGDFGLGISGLKDYIAESAGAAAVALNGLTRSADLNMLGGLRVDGTTGASIADIVVDQVVAYMNASGPSSDLQLFCNPRVMGSLSKQLDGKWCVEKSGTVNGKDLGGVGYKSFQVNLEGCSVSFTPDPSCPTKRMFLLDMDTWCFFSAKMAPRFLLQQGGHDFIKPSENEDAWEARVGWYGNLVTNAPGYNCVALLP